MGVAADSGEAVSDARTTVVTMEQNVTVEWVHRLDGLKGKQTRGRKPLTNDVVRGCDWKSVQHSFWRPQSDGNETYPWLMERNSERASVIAG